jgi:hypothetical protein
MESFSHRYPLKEYWTDFAMFLGMLSGLVLEIFFAINHVPIVGHVAPVLLLLMCLAGEIVGARWHASITVNNVEISAFTLGFFQRTIAWSSVVRIMRMRVLMPNRGYITFYAIYKTLPKNPLASTGAIIVVDTICGISSLVTTFNRRAGEHHFVLVDVDRQINDELIPVARF